MANKNLTLGYILSCAGLLSLALTAEPVRKAISINALNGISSVIFMIIGIVLAAAGVFLIIKNPSSSSKVQDLPIYEGDKIVGFRRHKPK
jgi:hypothetical protein